MLKKIFCGESVAFLFVFQVLLLVLYGVLGAVWWCFCVKFCVGLRDVSCWHAWCLGMLRASWEKELRRRRGQSLGVFFCQC